MSNRYTIVGFDIGGTPHHLGDTDSMAHAMDEATRWVVDFGVLSDHSRQLGRVPARAYVVDRLGDDTATVVAMGE